MWTSQCRDKRGCSLQKRFVAFSAATHIVTQSLTRNSGVFISMQHFIASSFRRTNYSQSSTHGYRLSTKHAKEHKVFQ